MTKNLKDPIWWEELSNKFFWPTMIPAFAGAIIGLFDARELAAVFLYISLFFAFLMGVTYNIHYHLWFKQNRWRQ